MDAEVRKYLKLCFHVVFSPCTLLLALLLQAATKLGQGNVFTGVCDSVHRGGVCLSACWDTTPLEQTPPQEQTPPRADTSPEQTHTPWEQAPPEQKSPLPKQTPPQSRHPPAPWEQTPSPPPPPGKQTTAYGKRAAGTHPTGMHSCLVLCLC